MQIYPEMFFKGILKVQCLKTTMIFLRLTIVILSGLWEFLR